MVLSLETMKGWVTVLDEDQPGLNFSFSGSVFPDRNHSSGAGSLYQPGGKPSAPPGVSLRAPLALLQDSIHAGGAVLGNIGLSAPHHFGRAVAAGPQPQSLFGAPVGYSPDESCRCVLRGFESV